MMNNAWFIGDSFTFGQGCNKDFPYAYHERYPDGELWTTIVSKHFNCNEKNMGGMGDANEYIINKLITNMEHFKPGDIVIVGSTHGSRFQIYDEYVGDFVSFIPWHFFDPKTSHNEIPAPTSDIIENKKFFNALKLYALKYRTLPEAQLTDYYDNQIRSLLNFIKGLNIRIFLWGYHIWGNFETINQAADLPDFHWSWLGHRQWSTKCIELIENGQEEFGTERYQTRDKKRYDKWKIK